MLLKEIVDIHSGLNYQKQYISLNQNSIPLIQVKDISGEQLKKDNVLRIDKQFADKNLILRSNDIIFSSKGSRNFAFYYKGDIGEATVTSTFFIFRIKTNIITPQYLSWFLNSKPAQEFIKTNSHGSIIHSISKSILSELEVPIPSLKDQETIINIEMNFNKEKDIFGKILEKKEMLINEILNRKIKNIIYE